MPGTATGAATISLQLAGRKTGLAAEFDPDRVTTVLRRRHAGWARARHPLGGEMLFAGSKAGRPVLLDGNPDGGGAEGIRDRLGLGLGLDRLQRDRVESGHGAGGGSAGMYPSRSSHWPPSMTRVSPVMYPA